MPSPRKGGTVPVRRRRRKATGVRVPVLPPASPTAFTRHRGGSDSSWTDTTDTSLASSSSGSYRGSSSPLSSSNSSGSDSSSESSPVSSPVSASPVSPAESSPSTSTASTSRRRSPSSSEGSSTEGSDEEDDDEGDLDGPSTLRRGRSCSRRGARNRGGSILCRFCGKRGYGGMKMIFTCCRKAVEESLQDSTSGVSSACSQLDSSRGSIASLEPEVVAGRADDLVVEVGTPPILDDCPSPGLISAAHCRKYQWSPCSSESSDDSSSTLSEGNPSSSGEDADVEVNKADTMPKATPRLLLLSRGHVAVQ